MKVHNKTALVQNDGRIERQEDCATFAAFTAGVG